MHTDHFDKPDVPARISWIGAATVCHHRPPPTRYGRTPASCVSPVTQLAPPPLPCAALFSFIGDEPASQRLSGCAAVDENRFVLIDWSLPAAR
jgi:hypothetical protein